MTTTGSGDARTLRRARSLRHGTLLCVLVLASTVSACSSSSSSVVSGTGVIHAVGAENQYANVLEQIGGRYVSVTSILNNPNTDPHTFEASPHVAQAVSSADLVVQNGVGYDSFMTQIEAASPNATRKVIVAQHVLGLPDSTPNPHLWYDPRTMPDVASAMARDLSTLDPSHAHYFAARLRAFRTSLVPWFDAMAAFKKAHGGTPVAVTEPVADSLLHAMGARIVTPFVFQADIMNGVDPSPQDISMEDHFFTAHKAKVFCYNQQVVDSLTTTIRLSAAHAHVPVVGVYETMPTPGYDYQSWMLAETNAISNAVTHGASTEKL